MFSIIFYLTKKENFFINKILKMNFFIMFKFFFLGHYFISINNYFILKLKFNSYLLIKYEQSHGEFF